MPDNPVPDSEPTTEFSATLSGQDLELVQRMCEIQSATSPEQLFGMTEALKLAKTFALQGKPDGITPDDVLEIENQLAGMIEARNAGGWRGSEVVIASGGSTSKVADLPQDMEKWAKLFLDEPVTATEQYLVHQQAHPYEDGNGRTGWAMWAIKTVWDGGEWPEVLPPDQFTGKPKTSNEYQSGFGQVEPD